LSWLELFWGWRGRLNRLQFFVGALLLGAIVMALGFTGLISPFPVRDEAGDIVLEENGSWIAHFAVLLVYAPLMASLLTRRLHDIGLDAWWVVLLWAAGLVWTQLSMAWPDAVPFWPRIVLGLPAGVMVLTAFIALSNEGPNRFGEQPSPGLPKRL
jgi:uncharacterized membrane protein YhaH (DUF805 family)